VIEIIGIALNVDKEKRTAELLKLQEQQLLEAQEISHIGSFSWNFNNQHSTSTPQLLKILEFGNDDPDNFFNRVHPDDKERVAKAINESKITGNFECEYRYQGSDKIKILLAKGKIVYENNEPVTMKGTVMDITETHNLLLRLQESENLYKQAQTLAHLGNWTLDLKTNLFVWSDEMYNIYEIEKNKKIWYEDWLSFVHPDDKEQVHNYLWKCISEKKPYEENYRIVINTPQPDGQEKIKTIQKKAELILDENGIPIKMTGTTQDVTQQKEYEHKLQENQNFIQKIADATPSIIASYNVNTGQYVFINAGFQKLLGYPAEIAMERGVQFLMELIHPDDLDTLIKQNTKALEAANDVHNEDNNDVIEFVYRMKHKNGTYRWFHTYGTIFDRNNAGKVEHLLNISLDITEQIESTQKIIDQEHFIEHIAEASPTILYLFDVPLNSIVYINHEIYYVSGYTTEEITEAGSIITTMLYHPDDYPLLPERKESNKKFQHQNSMMQYECRMKSKDGEWKWLLIREVIFKSDEEGKPLQILGAALDISKRKEMEKSILQNAYQLEQSNLSLEEFAYVASHDLKEPLRKISTFGDRLVATQLERLTDDGKIYLKKIVDASQRMQTMINDLLSVSMISGNKAFQTYSLQVILEEVKQALEYKIEQQNAVIEGKDLPEATIIPSQFRQLFQNILSNSLKFVKEDVQTVIKISYTYLIQEDVHNFQLQKANSYLKIVFEDNGIGFEDEYAGKIFQIFHRLHGRSEYEGTGIGLAICKKIIEHHGGIIYATGKQNIGATMTLILPN
jgi:PAS domain S-box-containing protein